VKALVDSCGWVEYLADGPLADEYGRLLRRVHEVVVPTVVQYEVYKWICREREEELALRVVGHMEQGIVRPLDTRVALLAADLSRERGLAMADAIVYAHARLEGVKLVTSDRHFEGLPGVVLHAAR
jgi:predicted nucleic acid-binding protein